MANFAGFIGPSYTGRAFQADAEESWNWYPEAVESPGGRTKTTYTLLSKPGFAVFAALEAAGDFLLDVTPSDRSSVGDDTVHFTVTVTPIDGFSGDVALSAVAVPSDGISFAFTPNPITGGSGTSNFAVTLTVIKEDGYAITITGTSGALTHTVPCTVHFIE
jgi:hypothetical protein